MFKKIKNFSTSSWAINTALLVYVLILFFRNAGLFSIVSTDELSYSQFSRLQPISESTIPIYLYLKIYSLTNFCGDNFYDCAKLLNICFFILSAPLVYSISRAVANHRNSLIVSILSVIGPISSYTAYYMPESFYFFGFWFFIRNFLKLENSAGILYWILSGITYGLLALIKPHSLFIAPAIIVYVYLLVPPSKKSLVIFLKLIALFFISAVATKILTSSLLTGGFSISIFGSLYSSVFESKFSDPERYLQLIPALLKNIGGHFLVLIFIFALPIATSIISIKELIARNYIPKLGKQNSSSEARISFLGTAILINLLLLIAFFTVIVSGLGPYETTDRLHMRYYNFAFPFFYIIVAGAIHTPLLPVKNTILERTLATLLLCAIIYCMYTNLHPYTHSIIDNPELTGIARNIIFFRIFGVISALSIILWVWNKNLALKFYFYLCLPIFALTTTYIITLEQRSFLVPNAYDKAGLFTKQYLPKGDLDKLVVIGIDPAMLTRTLFILDSMKVTTAVVPHGALLDISSLPKDKEWLLVIGYNSLPKTFQDQLTVGEFTLVHIPR